MHDNFSVARDLTGSLVEGISTLPASFKATYTDSSALAATTWPPDRVLATGARTPLK